METAVRVNGLYKRYKDVEALRGVEFDIYKGEVFGLLGVNGAGKSTTIRILSCLTAPDSGDAYIMNRSVTREPSEVKKLINISPQETAVAPSLSTRENLELAAGLWGADRGTARKCAETYITRFGMESIAKKRARTLSGGWQRRLSIAMALITDPQVLFLDEPTLGVDILARRELWTFVREMRGNKTVILTTHYLEEAEALCDRIAIMSHGNLIALGTAEELKRQAGCSSFEEAFVRLAGEEKV